MGFPILKGPVAPGALAGVLMPTTARNFPDFGVTDFGGKRKYSYSPSESAALLPQTAIWISQQGVTTADAGTTANSWASYLGGISSTVTSPAATNRPAYSATGGVGSRPLLTFDGVDNVLEGTVTKGSGWTSYEGGIVGNRVAGNATDVWIMMHQSGGFIFGVSDNTSTSWRALTGTTVAAGTTNPNADNAFWSGSAITNEVASRRNGTAQNTTASGTVGTTNEPVTCAIGGRIATSEYGNIAIQAAVWGVRLTTDQRTYLRGLLNYWTGITT